MWFKYLPSIILHKPWHGKSQECKQSGTFKINWRSNVFYCFTSTYKWRKEDINKYKLRHKCWHARKLPVISIYILMYSWLAIQPCSWCDTKEYFISVIVGTSQRGRVTLFGTSQENGCKTNLLAHIIILHSIVISFFHYKLEVVAKFFIQKRIYLDRGTDSSTRWPTFLS